MSRDDNGGLLNHKSSCMVNYRNESLDFPGILPKILDAWKLSEIKIMWKNNWHYIL